MKPLGVVFAEILAVGIQHRHDYDYTGLYAILCHSPDVFALRPAAEAIDEAGLDLHILRHPCPRKARLGVLPVQSAIAVEPCGIPNVITRKESEKYSGG